MRTLAPGPRGLDSGQKTAASIAYFVFFVERIRRQNKDLAEFFHYHFLCRHTE